MIFMKTIKKISYSIQFIEDISAFYTKEKSLVSFKKEQMIQSVTLIDKKKAKKMNMVTPQEGYIHIKDECGHLILHVPEKSIIWIKDTITTFKSTKIATALESFLNRLFSVSKK